MPRPMSVTLPTQLWFWVAVGLCGCSSEKKDIQQLCIVIDESIKNNINDVELRSKMAKLSLRTPAGNALAINLTSGQASQRYGAMRELAAHARTHGLQDSCVAAAQVAALADAMLQEMTRVQKAGAAAGKPAAGATPAK